MLNTYYIYIYTMYLTLLYIYTPDPLIIISYCCKLYNLSHNPYHLLHRN